MSKWYGTIGFAVQTEYEPGCWDDNITEHTYYGDIISNRWKRENSGVVNDCINLANQISIIADPFVLNHITAILYIEYMGTKWKVSEVDTSQYPRLILTIGGMYNGDTNRTSE